jgi:hypothetical protein
LPVTRWNSPAAIAVACIARRWGDALLHWHGRTLFKAIALAAATSLSITAAPAHGALAQADEDYHYIYNAPESDMDVRYLYHWEILKAALERTRPKYGPFTMAPSLRMSEKRQTAEMLHGSSLLNVMYLGTTRQLEERLLPIRIPVDKNLGGYNVFLIRKEDAGRFADVRSLDGLRRFSYGLGYGWIDVGILRASDFKVVTGEQYDGLFTMLLNKRFDVFLRAATEVLDEVEQRKDSMPNLYIENSILLYYPLPMYFWFSRTAQGRKLAERAEAGMRMMIADGEFNRIFEKHQRKKIERLHLRERELFKIENPFLSPETPFADKKLWFDPYQDRPPTKPRAK